MDKEKKCGIQSECALSTENPMSSLISSIKILSGFSHLKTHQFKKNTEDSVLYEQLAINKYTHCDNRWRGFYKRKQKYSTIIDGHLNG